MELVKSQVMTQIRMQAWDKSLEKTKFYVWDQLGKLLWDKVEDQVMPPVWLKVRRRVEHPNSEDLK